MLCAGSDAVGRVEPRSLITAHVRAGHRGAQKRIFPGAFSHSAPTRVSGNIYHRRKSPADAAGGGFARGDAGSLLHQVRIPRRSQTQRNGKFGSKTMNYIQTKDERDVQARLFHRNMLNATAPARRPPLPHPPPPPPPPPPP